MPTKKPAPTVKSQPASDPALTSHIAEPLQHLAMPIAGLNPDPRNARIHDERNMQAILRSLERFGQRQPIVVQKKGMIVRAGNARLEAAKRLGWTTIAAVVVDDDDLEAISYAIADNRTAELARWDDEVLQELLENLQLEEVNLLDVGFRENELPSARAGEGADEADDVPGMELQWDEHFDYLVFLFRSPDDFIAACSKFGVRKVNGKAVHGGKQIGLGRVLDGKKLL